jgi:hypothetical protein
MLRFEPPHGVLLALATLVAIALAILGLPIQPLTIGLGSLAAVLVAGEILVINRESQRRAARSLTADAHELANEIRALVHPNADFGSRSWSDTVASNYRYRYAQRVRDVALRLRRYNLVPKHAFYRAVSVGPQDYAEVWAIATGLDSIADLLALRPQDRRLDRT